MTYICAPIFVTIPRDNGISVDFQPTGGVEVAIPSGPKGLDGVSPTIEVTDILGGHKVTITDVNGTEEFNVMDGGISESDFLKVFPTDTASGAVATFPDGSDQVPLKTLTVAIDPVQNLNGYDNPWPAGGGKNIARITQDNGTVGDVTFTAVKDDSGNILWLKASGTITANANITIATVVVPADGSYRFSGLTTGSNTTAVIQLRNSTDTVVSTRATDESSNISMTAGTYTIVYRVLSGATISNMEIKPMVRLSSSEAGFAPYSNICPISGWTEAKVTRTGVNIWDEQTEDGYITTTGVLAPYANAIRSKNYTPCKPNEKYVHHHKQGMNGCTIAWYDESKTFIQRDSVDSSDNVVVTAPGNAYYFKLSFYNYKAQDASTYNNDVSINYPHTNSGYYAYSGASVTIDLNGTRYGGTLDVLTGVLTVDREEVDLGTLNWYRNAIQDGGNRFGTIGLVNDIVKQNVTMICSNYKTVPYGDTYRKIVGIGCAADGVMYIYDSTLEAYTKDQFKTAMSGVQLVYPLASPQTVQLTAQQVSSLLGANNVWTDTGDVSVVYRADIGLFIDKKLNA